MYYIVVCVCFAACVLGAPAPTDVVPLEKEQPTVIPIISQSDELEPNGTYHFSYETGNGIKREEISYDKVVPKAKGRSADSNEGGEDSDSASDDEIHVQMGSYSYTAPDGTLISVRYVADENGFQPIGDHIPRVPSATGSGSSNEKSGRALNVNDNAESSSAPVAAIKTADKPAALSAAAPAATNASVPGSESKLDATTETASAEAEPSSKAVDIESSTTEAVQTPEAASTAEASSTTEAAQSSEAPAETSTSDAGTTEAANSSTSVPDASTTAAVDVTTLASKESTPNAEASTTIAA